MLHARPRRALSVKVKEEISCSLSGIIHCEQRRSRCDPLGMQYFGLFITFADS